MDLINFIDYNDNIKIINNIESSLVINNIDKDFLNRGDWTINKCENVLLESIKIDSNKTSYNIDHLYCVFQNSTNLKPNSNTLNNFYKVNSNKIYNSNASHYIENGVFLNSFTECHSYITHIALDFVNGINMFHELLVNNPDFVIIIEFIPHNTFFGNTSYDHSFDSVCAKNIEMYTMFLRDIGITNEIKIISDVSMFQNFEHSLFIKNLYTLTFQTNNIIWIPLYSKLLKNSKGKYMGDTLRDIINYKSPNKYKKKFLILEKRLTSSFHHERNIPEDSFEILYDICLEYCYRNNLELFIWSNEMVQKTSIYEQFVICHNAEIIIQTGGSLSMFNYSMESGKLLMFNAIIEYDLYDMSFYNNFQTQLNKNIKHYFHYRDVDNPISIECLVYNFLNNLG